jgi:hypothetical protein
VAFKASKNASAIASAIILFTKLKFLILFSLDIALIRGGPRRAFEDARPAND